MKKKKHIDRTFNHKRKRKKLQVIDQELQKSDIEADRGQLSDFYKQQYEKRVEEAIQKGLKEYEGDFFISAHMRNEKGYENVLPRTQVKCLRSCPHPTADQIVYRYHRRQDNLECLWMVPSRDMCMEIQINPLCYGYHLDTKKWVFDFLDGTLDKMSNAQNDDVFGHDDRRITT